MPIQIQSTGTGSKTWSVSAGALPSGITLNTSTGILSGTPTVAGTFNFTIQVAVAGCFTDTQSYVLVVNAATSSTITPTTSETTTSSTTAPPTTSSTSSPPITTSSTSAPPTTSSTSSPPTTTSSTTTPTTSSTSTAPLPVQSPAPVVDGPINNSFRWVVTNGCSYGIVVFYRNGTQIGSPVVASASGVAAMQTTFNTGDLITAKQTCPSDAYQSELSNSVAVVASTGYCPTPAPCLEVDQCGVIIQTLPNATVTLYFNNNQLIETLTVGESGSGFVRLIHTDGQYTAFAQAPNMAISQRSCSVKVTKIPCCPPPVTPNYQILPLL